LPLPTRIQQNIESFKAAHPLFTHRLYTDSSLRDYISRHFEARVLRAYDELVPLAYKADLGRYCLMYREGGIYSDLSVFFFKGLCVTSPKTLHVFREDFSTAPWIASITILAAPAGMEVFRRCIARICAHTQVRYYGPNALCPTGPVLFGAELAASTPPEGLRNGKVVHLNKGFNRYPVFAFVSAEGDLIAFRNKESPGIASLGIEPSHTYGELYNLKEIYNSEKGAPKVFLASEYYEKGHIRNGWLCDEGKQVFLSEASGIRIFGPYLKLACGSYTFEFSFSGGAGCGKALSGFYDIVAQFGQKTILGPTPFTVRLAASEAKLIIDYTSETEIEQGEIRIATESSSAFLFNYLKIIRRF
jgi:hypothetical protein